jgi:hypothetical protein
MPLNGGASPGKSPTPRHANGIFRENLRQRFCEIVIKGRDIRAAVHGLTPTGWLCADPQLGGQQYLGNSGLLAARAHPSRQLSPALRERILYLPQSPAS